MRRPDFVVAIGPDQHQVPQIGIGKQVLQEFKSCPVQPLQIVEKQRERVLRPGKYSEESTEYQLEPVPRILRRQVRDRRLLSDDKFPLRDEVDDKLAICTYSLLNSATPLVHLRFALNEDLPDKGLKSLGQSRVRDVAFVLVELARREQAARRTKRLVQLVHHGGFADPGISGYEHEFRCAMGHDPVEGFEQGIDLALPPVELLRDQ